MKSTSSRRSRKTPISLHPGQNTGWPQTGVMLCWQRRGVFHVVLAKTRCFSRVDFQIHFPPPGDQGMLRRILSRYWLLKGKSDCEFIFYITGTSVSPSSVPSPFKCDTVAVYQHRFEVNKQETQARTSPSLHRPLCDPPASV